MTSLQQREEVTRHRWWRASTLTPGKECGYGRRGSGYSEKSVLSPTKASPSSVVRNVRYGSLCRPDVGRPVQLAKRKDATQLTLSFTPVLQ